MAGGERVPTGVQLGGARLRRGYARGWGDGGEGLFPTATPLFNKSGLPTPSLQARFGNVDEAYDTGFIKRVEAVAAEAEEVALEIAGGKEITAREQQDLMWQSGTVSVWDLEQVRATPTTGMGSPIPQIEWGTPRTRAR